MSALAQKQIVIDEILLNYYSNAPTKDASGEVFVFLHGWRSDGTIWFDVADDMNDELYCLDLPGFGKSSSPKRAMDLGDYANLVRGFINKLRLTNVVLVGHSFGGRTAIKLVSADPTNIKRLVLVDSAGFAASSIRKTALKVAAKGVKPIFKPAFMHPLRRRVYAMMGAEDYVATPELKDTFVKVVNEDLSEAMKTIGVPTILIWGEQDKETPLTMGKRMATLIPNSRLEVIKGAGHFSFLDYPKRFVELLKSK